jgi:hypothetical protein
MLARATRVHRPRRVNIVRKFELQETLMSDDKKIIVDEDWKSRVTAEKEAATREHAPAPKGTSGEPASAGGGSRDSPPMPPASFEMLVTTLATEAMIGLGQFPHPVTGKMHPDAAQARYAIDMLEMLAEKTKGNLTPGEDRGMRDLLHQLRMAFVAGPKAVASSAADEATS